MADALADLEGVRAVHIIAHGAPGEIAFSAGALGLDTLAAHAADLARIGDALDHDGELLLWSCETGQGTRGERFVEALCWATGAPVAAASGRVGAVSRGGSWELDVRLCDVVIPAPLSQVGMISYQGLMTITISSATITSITTDTGTSSTDFLTNDTTLILGGSITAASGGGTGTLGIWLTGGAFGTGTLVGSVSVSGTGAWSFDLTSSSNVNAQSLADGTYTITITNNNTSITPSLSTHSLTEDHTAPTAPTIASITDDVSPV